MLGWTFNFAIRLQLHGGRRAVFCSRRFAFMEACATVCAGCATRCWRSKGFLRSTSAHSAEELERWGLSCSCTLSPTCISFDNPV